MNIITNRIKVSTTELLKLIKSHKYVEASLNNGLLNATHLIRFGGRKYFDIGIDSQEIRWKENEFLLFYEKSFWKIDQLIKEENEKFREYF